MSEEEEPTCDDCGAVIPDTADDFHSYINDGICHSCREARISNDPDYECMKCGCEWHSSESDVCPECGWAGDMDEIEDD